MDMRHVGYRWLDRMEGGMQHHPLLVTNILDHAARWNGEQVIISRQEEGPTITTCYREIHERAKLCALALQRLGVKPGDRVGTLAWNNSRHIEAWYGIMGSGAICHTLNPRLYAADLEYIINHAEDCILLLDVCFAGLVAQLRPKLSSVKAFVVLTDRGHMHRSEAAGLGPALCYDDILEAEREGLPGFRWVRVGEDDACGLCYTSGTTGRPKGVLYSHRANTLHALQCALVDACCLSSRSVILVVVPLFHANAWGLVFCGPLTGAKLILPGPFLDGESVYNMLEEHACNFSAGVPTVFQGLLQYLKESGRKLHHLRRTCIGGAACPRSMLKSLQDEHGVEVRHMWGMTELAPLGTLAGRKGTLPKLTKEQQLALQSKQGRPVPFVDMRIVDERGAELPRDGKAFGDLQVRGPHVVSRYFRHEGDHGVDAEGWFSTGDVATIDAWGHMAITDRSKDVIKSGGEWISSIDVENAAMSHPQVVEAAVIGIFHPKWSERPLLIAVADPKRPPSKDDLLSFLKGKVAKWWIPEHVVFVKELPHTATGKLSKLQLRQRFKDYRPEEAKL